jgi:hypothetical protein
MPEIKASIACFLAGESKMQRMTETYNEAYAKSTSHLQAQHGGLPRQLSQAFMKRYLEETGRDIARDYHVNPLTGLSAVACCFPNCDLFLTLPDGSAKRKRSLLKAHLLASCCTVIPGLHTSVAQFCREPVSDVLCKVKSGHCLKQPFPSRSFGSEGYDYADLQRSHQALMRRLDCTIDAFNSGDSMRLYHLVEQMQDSAAAGHCGWSYESFKDAFDRKWRDKEY